MSEMRDKESGMSVWEADERAQKGASELEEVINRFNNDPDREDKLRHADLASHFISLLAEMYGIADPNYVKTE